ncbi:MAG TPA: diaminopimelate epimerase [Stellaceae bacterium]|nr:diaminopimelate epimerase [Stellaceae bacterium]
MRIAFRKMHGIGNDFVVLDQRRDPVPVGAAAARALADRHTGIGCDQLLLLEPPRDARAQVFMRILNPDGGEAKACGNGTRCVAALIAAEIGRSEVAIETAGGLLAATLDAGGIATVDMGAPRLAWCDIPLSREMDTLRVDLAVGPLAEPVCTNMGNPHATFFVDDAEAIDLAALGPRLEHDALFPERANIGVATVRDPGTIRLRVWERGAGITRACGSGACAALVAAHRRGLTGERATVVLDGGDLAIAWPGRGHVLMSGPAALSFEGTFDAALLAG